MDITLPSGLQIKGIPDGLSRNEIREQAISKGIATPEDFQLNLSDVDTRHGLPLKERAVITSLPQIADQQQALQSRGYNTSTTVNGDLVAKKGDGQWTLANPSGLDVGDLADIGSETFGLGTSIVGGLIGSLGGPVGTVAGGGVGYGGGKKVAQEALQDLMGTQEFDTRTALEQFEEVGIDTGIGLAAEIGGPLISRGFSKAVGKTVEVAKNSRGIPAQMTRLDAENAINAGFIKPVSGEAGAKVYTNEIKDSIVASPKYRKELQGRLQKDYNIQLKKLKTPEAQADIGVYKEAATERDGIAQKMKVLKSIDEQKGKATFNQISKATDLLGYSNAAVGILGANPASAIPIAVKKVADYTGITRAISKQVGKQLDRRLFGAGTGEEVATSALPKLQMAEPILKSALNAALPEQGTRKETKIHTALFE